MDDRERDIQQQKMKADEAEKNFQSQFTQLQKEKDSVIKEKNQELKEMKKSIAEDASRTQRYPNPQMSVFEKQIEIQRNENYSVISPENYEESRKVSAMKKITEELVDKLKKQKKQTQVKQEKIEQVKEKKRAYKTELG